MVQEELVKLQVLNLAVRLYLTNNAQTSQLVHYVFTLARYDQSYDLRDRSRLLRNLVCSTHTRQL
jgi:AP-3 complex subunit beta